MVMHGGQTVIVHAGAAIALYLVVYLALYAGIVLYPREGSMPHGAAGATKLAGLIWAFLLVSYYLTDLLVVAACVVFGVAIWLVFRAERLRTKAAVNQRPTV
jgi:hypothetical protein